MVLQITEDLNRGTVVPLVGLPPSRQGPHSIFCRSKGDYICLFVLPLGRDPFQDRDFVFWSRLPLVRHGVYTRDVRVAPRQFICDRCRWFVVVSGRRVVDAPSDTTECGPRGCGVRPLNRPWVSKVYSALELTTFVSHSGNPKNPFTSTSFG